MKGILEPDPGTPSYGNRNVVHRQLAISDATEASGRSFREIPKHHAGMQEVGLGAGDVAQDQVEGVRRPNEALLGQIPRVVDHAGDDLGIDICCQGRPPGIGLPGMKMHHRNAEFAGRADGGDDFVSVDWHMWRPRPGRDHARRYEVDDRLFEHGLGSDEVWTIDDPKPFWDPMKETLCGAYG